MSRHSREVGDGDICPLNPEHGQMCFLTGSQNQWCPDRSHDGTTKTPATRALWPKGIDSFRRAVRTVTLPEIDIKMLGG